MNKLSETKVVTREVTFPVPNVLISYEGKNDFPILTLRQGGSRQVKVTVSTDIYDSPVKEKSFSIKARNQINFGSLRIDVLNDAITGDKPIAPSCPTASDYMRNVGKTVMTSFRCDPVKIDGKNLFRVIRSHIVLP